MFTNVRQNTKRSHRFMFPHDIIHFLFTFFSVFCSFCKINTITPFSLQWFFYMRLALNYWNDKYSMTLENTWALGPDCETLFFLAFLISNWNLKCFKCIFILCFIMHLKDFPIEIRFTCAKIYFNPIKINIKPTLWSCRLTLEL